MVLIGVSLGTKKAYGGLEMPNRPEGYYTRSSTNGDYSKRKSCLVCGSRNTGSSVPHDEVRKISPKWKNRVKKTHYCYNCGAYFTDDSHSSSGTIGTGI